MHLIRSRSMLCIAVSLLGCAALPSNATAASGDGIRTYRVENLRTAKDRAPDALHGVGEAALEAQGRAAVDRLEGAVDHGFSSDG